MLNCIKSYLYVPSYKAQIGGVLSNDTPCLSDVPKLSVVGPLVFLIYIYIDDLHAALGDSFLQMT